MLKERLNRKGKRATKGGHDKGVLVQDRGGKEVYRQRQALQHSFVGPGCQSSTVVLLSEIILRIVRLTALSIGHRLPDYRMCRCFWAAKGRLAGSNQEDAEWRCIKCRVNLAACHAILGNRDVRGAMTALGTGKPCARTPRRQFLDSYAAQGHCAFEVFRCSSQGGCYHGTMLQAGYTHRTEVRVCAAMP